jgi:predicted GNAT superfamily acetyltransferase
MSSDFTRTVASEITIRRAESVADYRACQEAQRLAWGIRDPGYVIPVATMVSANLHGGLVLGAFLADGRAVGISFGFLGRLGDRLCLYSQLTGIVPGYQSHGLGRELKLVQRDHALASGLSLIAWAFDPLQAGNAHFNLERLGASVRHFVDNMYGERTDALNAGVPTDRVIAEWELDEEPGARMARDPRSALAVPRLIGAATDEAGRVVPTGVNPVPSDSRLLLEIPPCIADLRRDDPALAESWRKSVRQAFHTGFAAGFRAVGFMREEFQGHRRSFYVLERAGTGEGVELV